jgi:hypothetical protein
MYLVQRRICLLSPFMHSVMQRNQTLIIVLYLSLYPPLGLSIFGGLEDSPII